MYDLNTECVSDQAWTYLKNSHGLDKLKNTDFQKQLWQFELMPFPHEIYYFESDPEELIAISAEHDCVRYVYNPQLSKNVLDGLSDQLKKKDKERIGNRIQLILRNFHCDEKKTHRYTQEWDKDE
jgi:hypothetical protein